jgi:hypothetical protein
MYNIAQGIGLIMYELIVLGLVPGTDIKITFELFVVFVLVLAVAALVAVELYKYGLLQKTNSQIIKLGLIVKRLLIDGQNALPPKLQLFK